MDEIKLTIDGKDTTARKGETILDAARSLGIEIPTLCYHKELKPYGGCRLCLVEIKQGSKSQLVASCGYYVKDGLQVETNSPRVRRARKLILELLLAILRDSEDIQRLAREHGITKSRYDRSLDYCIHCGLCVRYCEEVKRAHCLGSVGRGIDREVAWIPLTTFQEHCEDCLECQRLCPTGVFPSNWGLADNTLRK